MSREEAERIRLFRQCAFLFGLASLLIFTCTVSALGQTELADPSSLHWEQIAIDDTAQLLTLFYRPEANQEPVVDEPDIPLISIVRDTLGSSNPEVHRLRYVWVHTYTTPSLRQRVAAAIPFLFSRIGNAPTSRKTIPRELVDLDSPGDPMWRRVRNLALAGLRFYPKPPIFESTTRTYTRNQTRYEQAQLSRAFTLLSLYDPLSSENPVLTPAELRLTESGLVQAKRFINQFLDSPTLERMSVKETIAMRFRCAQNWELLRQRADAEGLYFEPLLLPDGTATHALLWAAKEDVEKKEKNDFDGRFLNISSPWQDKSLLDSKEITETRYVDSANRPVEPETPGAREVELHPLALYGLDYPKIPTLLIDFRKPLNAKQRELSARAKDAAASLVPVSTFTKLGQLSIHFITQRKGRDLFQPTRFHSYSQLKTVLMLDSSLSPLMRNEIARRLEIVADNPLENNFNTELGLARHQYQSLVSYVLKPDGLRTRLQHDRREELAATSHSGMVKALLKIPKVATFGQYSHREADVPELQQRLATVRRNDTHEDFLRNVIKSGHAIEVNWNLEKVQLSLRYTAINGTMKSEDLANTAIELFTRTQDEKTRRLCLETIRQLEAQVAERALTRLLRDKNLDARWRTLSAEYLEPLAAPRPVANASPAQTVTNGLAN